MADSQTRAATRARAAQKQMTEDAPVTDAPPVVPPPVADEAPEFLERLDSLETIMASLAEKLNAVRDQADEREVSAAEALEALEASDKQQHELLVKLDEVTSQHGEALTGIGQAVEHVLGVVNKLQEVGVREQDTDLGYSGEHIHVAVVDVMRKVRAIGKEGQAPGNVGGYAFRKVDDIMDAVGGAMRDYAVFIRPEVVKYDRNTWTAGGKLWTEVVLTMRYHWVSGADGSTFSVESVGEGRDLGDKATSKAQAMAYKDMLLRTLCIPLAEVTGHDVENEAPESAAPDRQTAYGYGHQPAESPGGRAHQRAATPPPPDRQAPQETPEQLAARGLARARAANTLAELEGVRARAEELGLLHVMVDGAQLQVHLLAQRGVLGGPPASPEEMPPYEEPYDGPLDGRTYPGAGQ